MKGTLFMDSVHEYLMSIYTISKISFYILRAVMHSLTMNHVFMKMSLWFPNLFKYITKPGAVVYDSAIQEI
jgi:hypothetical protein